MVLCRLGIAGKFQGVRALSGDFGSLFPRPVLAFLTGPGVRREVLAGRAGGLISWAGGWEVGHFA